MHGLGWADAVGVQADEDRKKRRAIRFRVLMLVFSVSRFGEIGLDLFGPQTDTVCAPSMPRASVPTR